MNARWGLFLAPSLAISLCILVFSQWIFWRGSLRRDLGAGLQADGFDLHNYREIFQDSYFTDTLLLSVGVSAAATLATLLIAFPVAYLLARSTSRWAPVLLGAVVVSSFVTIVVKVLGLILLFSAKGPVNALLVGSGLLRDPVALLGTVPGAIVGLMYYSFGFAVLLLYSVVSTVPRTLEDAACIHGASRPAVFRQVVLPLCLPGLVGGALIVFNVSMGGFSSTALIGAGKVLTLPVVIQRTMLLENNYGMAAALAVVLLLSVVAINALSLRLVARSRQGLLA